MGIFDLFRKKNSSGIKKDNPDDIIVQKLEVGDFGGARPGLTLRESGNAYLIVEMPPFHDGDGNDIDGDEDFPELMVFEKLMADYVGTPVIRDDREVFIIRKANPEILRKVKEFMENYWTLRKDQYKKR